LNVGTEDQDAVAAKQVVSNCQRRDSHMMEKISKFVHCAASAEAHFVVALGPSRKPAVQVERRILERRPSVAAEQYSEQIGIKFQQGKPI